MPLILSPLSLSAMAILAPSLAAAIAQAFPIPDKPPVIKTVLLFNFFRLFFQALPA